MTSFCSLASKVSAWPGGTVGLPSPGKLAPPPTARTNEVPGAANGVPACPADKLDCRTRSQAIGGVFHGDLNLHAVPRRHSTASSRLVGVEGGHLPQKAAQQWRPRPRWSSRCRSFGRAGATGSAGSRALRSSAEAAEWPRASFFSWGWPCCSLWLLQKYGDDGPALPCHGAAASACKGHQGQQHMTLACMRVLSCGRLFVHDLCRAFVVRFTHWLWMYGTIALYMSELYVICMCEPQNWSL